MFEHDRDYPAAVTVDGSKRPEDAQRHAVKWVLEQARTVGGQVLIYGPTKQNITDSNGLIGRLAAENGVVTTGWRGTIAGWSGGPVLAAWPDRDHLAKIADDRRVRALCVVPFGTDAITAWAGAAKPQLLGDAQLAVTAPNLDPVVAVALTHLTSMVNHASNLVGPYDRRDAVAVLRTLHKGGYPLSAADVYAWSLAHGWPARGADRLREMTEKIAAGRTVQLKGTWPFKADILQRWEAEARFDV
ncbi:hypothetical protein [Curtobacterium sp. MCLR17_055]|uniref:hypothetical protein n=1 Tax=Curtobacterium sp. MCLR17_055 TaxID=2175633 RepID=UPI0011B717E3|nr:hypothetical protein [Curtobacterium sp. MCLR17_055]